jgi:hypothetical protein
MERPSDTDDETEAQRVLPLGLHRQEESPRPTVGTAALPRQGFPKALHLPSRLAGGCTLFGQLLPTKEYGSAPGERSNLYRPSSLLFFFCSIGV